MYNAVVAMVKILHFSDIHIFSFPSSLLKLLNKRTLGVLNFVFKRKRAISWENLHKLVKLIQKEKPDIIVFTGDSATIATKKEFELAYTYLEPIVNNKSFEFLAVAGNHDFYVKDKECKENVKELFFKLNRKRWYLDDFPIIHSYKEIDFFLSQQAHANPLCSSHGTFSLKEEKALKNYIQEKQTHNPLVFLGHFPIRNQFNKPLVKRRALKFSSAVEEAFLNNHIALYLCGHIHKHYAIQEGKSQLYCSGSLTLNNTINKILFDTKTQLFSQSWLFL